MKKLGLAFDKVLEIAGIIPGIIIALLAVGVAAEVFARNFDMSGFYWMLEAVEYGLLLLTMLGTAYVLSIGRHVTVDLVVGGLPPGPKRWFRICINIFVVVVSAVIFWYGIVTAHQAFVEDSTLYKSFEIKEWWPASVVPVGMGLFLIEAIRQLWISIFHPEEATEVPSETNEVF
jgi:C4-dicarboxylate transporter DctQ subunit